MSWIQNEKFKVNSSLIEEKLTREANGRIVYSIYHKVMVWLESSDI